MLRSGKGLRNSTGVVLISVLTILSVLLAVGIGIRVMLQNDYRVLANLRGGTEAFYYSAAGVEWSKDELARDTAFPPAPVSQTKTFASGGFGVSFLTPVIVDPVTARVVVRSVGTVGNSSQVLQAQLSRGYDLSDGALALRGNASRVNLVGGAAFISGIDHDPLNGNSLPETKSRNAVTFSDDALKDLFLQALGNPAPLGVLESATDVPAITSSSYLPASAIVQFANDLCAAPGVSLHPVPAGGNVTFENQVWGSQLSPQLHCVEGAVGSGDTATFAGSVSGSGILVVKEADMILTDTFRWEGWVIVTGQEVGLKASGSSIKEVLGAVLVNETGSPGSSTAILDIQGNLRLLFSRTTLRRSAQLIPNTTLTSNYAALPTFVVQDYWRAVNP